MSTLGDSKKASILKQFRHREAQRSTAKKIKFLRGKLTRNSTTIVTVKNEEGLSVNITDKCEMEKAIIASNKKHLLRPSTSHPTIDYLGIKA
jgi:hypothetical protein